MVSSATPTIASVPRVFPRTASRRAGTKSRCSCASGIESPATGLVSGTASGHADGEARVDEPERRRPAPAGQEQRADPEERSRQQPAEEVVDAEGLIVPARCRSPGQRGRRGCVGAETGGPGGELRLPALAPAAGEQPGEAKGEEGGGEREQGFHDVRVS